jgi:hypothetical protein
LEKINIKKISDFDSNLFYLKSFPILSGVFLKKKINVLKLTEKYNQGYNSRFKKIYETKYWTKIKNFEEFCFTKSLMGTDFTKLERKIIENKLCYISRYDYFKHHYFTVLEYLKKYTDTETIVELGSGYGLVLFVFKFFGLKNTLEGYEMDDYGIKIAKEVNNFFDLNIKFDKMEDLTENSKIKNNFEGKTVFTHYVLHNIKNNFPKSIENILNLNPKQVLHFEPIYEKHQNDLKGITCKTYLKSVNYQTKILTTIKEFENKGKLKILDTQNIGIGGQPFDKLFLIRYRPT